MKALILAVFIVTPLSASAADNFTISTTYDCTEQNQKTSGWISCDGLRKGLDNCNRAGNCEQITSEANYPNGLGGRGQRHWIGDGLNNGSGSIIYSFRSSSSEVWTRWYVRWQSGLQLGSNSSPHKVQYYNLRQCAGHSGGCYFAIGSNYLRLTNAGRNYTSDYSFGWFQLHGDASSKEAWHCFETMVRINTPGKSDGIAQWWIDGILRLARLDVYYAASPGNFTGFLLPSNGDFITGGTDKFEDIDDVEVSNTGRIGCLANTQSDTPPAVPQN